MTRLALHWQILIMMVAGAGLGVVLNAKLGTSQTDPLIEHSSESVQVLGMSRAIKVLAGRLWVSDSPERILLQVEDLAADGSYSPRRIVVGEQASIERQLRELGEPWPKQETVSRIVVPTLSVLEDKDPVAYAMFQQYGRSSARRVGDIAKALGDLFLRLLKMVSVPLIITSLITGIVGLGHVERLGKMFGRTLLYYLSTSMLAIVVGLAMVNLIQPGDNGGAPEEAAVEVQDARQSKSLGIVLFEQLQNMIPPNPIAAVSTGKFLSIIAFSLAFGVCTILVGGAPARHIGELFEAMFQVMMKLTMAIISLAPIGVFFLMLSATASQGAGVFSTLGWYMLTVACALAIHAGIILPLILHFLARRNPAEFAKAMSPALLTAFSSASSNGTLPLTLTCVEQRAKISNRVGSFVLPLGATINMDGTALYEVVAVLFIAQFSGVELTLAQQIVVALTALLASIGAAGIPHAGLVMMVIILQAVGLPTESQGMIIAVDRVLDMLRTAVNVWSDSCGCAVVSRFESSGSA